MTDLPSWLFVALIAGPALHAEVLPWIPGQRNARLVAALGASLSIFVAGSLAALFISHVDDSILLQAEVPIMGGHGVHFVIDGLSGPLLPIFSLLTFAVIVGTPRSQLSVSNLRALLWVEALTLLALTADDLLVLWFAWTAVVLPLDQLTAGEPQANGRMRVQRVFRIYHRLALACFLLGCLALLVWAPSESLLGPRLLRIDGSTLPAPLQPLVFGALAVAAMLRMGIAPFHSWLPVSLESGASAGPAVLVATRASLYVLVRVAIPAFPETAHGEMPLLTALGLCGAVYGALGALGQHDLRRLIALFITSQSGLMLTGVALRDRTAAAGTLLYWLSFAMTTTGLLLMVSALTARTGSGDMRTFGGVVRSAPGLAASFFLFGLANIAIPGTPAFAAQDMLVHGALTQHPLLTLLMVGTIILNTVAFLRAFNRTFLGPASPGPAAMVPDLTRRERAVATLLLVVLIGTGLFPGPLVGIQSSAATWIGEGRIASRSSSDLRGLSPPAAHTYQD